jgi:hypothetical protein
MPGKDLVNPLALRVAYFDGCVMGLIAANSLSQYHANI